MKKIPKLISLQALTFLHPGTGQSTGVVDLPIQREVHTEFPIYAASGLKGSLRDKAEQEVNNESNEGVRKQKKKNLISLFGADAQSETLSAGAFSITEARILAFPVRSLQNVFMWVTCPLVLEKLKRDIQITKLNIPDIGSLEIPSVSNEEVKTNNTELQSPLVLEELAFAINNETDVEKLENIGKTIKSLMAENSSFDEKKLVVISDSDFKYLVKYATQISARIKLNEDKTTTGKGGNLWYEETLPPETILYSLILFNNPRKPTEQMRNSGEVADSFSELIADGFIQIGGNETVGQGWCSIKIMPEGVS